MIDINGQYRIKKETHQWVLSRKSVAKDKKTGEDKDKWIDSYHATIEQCCNAILNHEAGECEAIDKLLQAMANANQMLITKVEEAA